MSGSHRRPGDQGVMTAILLQLRCPLSMHFCRIAVYELTVGPHSRQGAAHRRFHSGLQNSEVGRAFVGHRGFHRPLRSSLGHLGESVVMLVPVSVQPQARVLGREQRLCPGECLKSHVKELCVKDEVSCRALSSPRPTAMTNTRRQPSPSHKYPPIQFQWGISSIPIINIAHKKCSRLRCRPLFRNHQEPGGGGLGLWNMYH